MSIDRLHPLTTLQEQITRKRLNLMLKYLTDSKSANLQALRFLAGMANSTILTQGFASASRHSDLALQYRYRDKGPGLEPRLCFLYSIYYKHRNRGVHFGISDK